MVVFRGWLCLAILCGCLGVRSVAFGESSAYDKMGSYWFALEDIKSSQVIVRDRLNGSSLGEGNLVLAPNTRYRYWRYWVEAKLVGFSEFTTPDSGLRFTIPKASLGKPQTPDRDGDGLSDEAEFILGTNPSNPDTNGNGVKDGAEVEGGTDPLSGVAFSVGLIASMDTPGIATDVCAINDTAFVADGPAGVAIFNIFSGTTPLRVAQIDTLGNCVAVASTGTRIIAADSEAGAVIIDYSDVANPTFMAQIAAGTLGGSSVQAVAAAGDRAFTGSTQGVITMLDFQNGMVLQSLELGGRVEDLAIEGLTLYAYAGARLHVLPFGRGLMERAGSVASPEPSGINAANGRGRLFVGGGIAYLTHTRGYNAISVRNPAFPQLLSAGSSPQFGWKHLVVNGSGTGVAAFSPNQAFDGPHDVGLFDTRELASGDMDSKFRAPLFATPGIARAVALYNGLAYVADHDAGLQVINYLPPDLVGTPPSGSLSLGISQDGVEILRQLAVVNGGFEASVPGANPGYVRDNGPIPGWQASPGAGINPGNGFGPFTDNGQIPEGDRVAFIQSSPEGWSGKLSQVVGGFEVGKKYQVIYRENARNCCSGSQPLLEVLVGGKGVVTKHRVSPVGGQNAYATVSSDVFEATAASMELVFAKTSEPAGDDTSVLIDDVRVYEVKPSSERDLTAGSLLVIRADVADDVQVRQVEFFVNGQRIGVDGNFPFEAVYQVPVNMVGRELNVTARATDMSGNFINLVLPPRLVQPDTAPPLLSVSAPKPNEILGDDVQLYVKAQAWDATGVDHLEFFVDGQLLTGQRLSLNDYSIPVRLDVGTHRLVVAAVDVGGQRVAAPPISFAVTAFGVSREFAVFNEGVPGRVSQSGDDPVDFGFSREVAVFNEGISGRVSQSGDDPVDFGFSREFAVFNEGVAGRVSQSSDDPVDFGFSREVALFNEGVAGRVSRSGDAPVDFGLSREVAVQRISSTLQNVTPAGGLLATSPAGVRLQFKGAVKTSALASPFLRVTGAGADGKIETADDVQIPMGAWETQDGGTVLYAAFSETLGPGTYRVAFDSPVTTDQVAVPREQRAWAFVVLPGNLRPGLAVDYFRGFNGGLEELYGPSKAPDQSAELPAFEIPVNADDNYGARVSGLLFAPVTGDYRFFMASDDQGALFLSTDESPANFRMIASEPAWNPSRYWVGTNGRNSSAPENRSEPIRLEAGRFYAMFAVMREFGGGDNLAVTWQRPGEVEPTNGSDPISAEYFAQVQPAVAPSSRPRGATAPSASKSGQLPAKTEQ